MPTLEDAEDAFFAALLEGDANHLNEVSTDDFVIADVMSGSVFDRRSFIAAVRDGVVTFGRIDVVERSARRYIDTAMIVGRTAMEGAVGETPFALASRYTHAFATRKGRSRTPTSRFCGSAIAGPSWSNTPNARSGDNP